MVNLTVMESLYPFCVAVTEFKRLDNFLKGRKLFLTFLELEDQNQGVSAQGWTFSNLFPFNK